MSGSCDVESRRPEKKAPSEREQVLTAYRDVAPGRDHARIDVNHLQVALTVGVLRAVVRASAELLHDGDVLGLGQHRVGELVEVLVLDPDVFADELDVAACVGGQGARCRRVSLLHARQLAAHLRAVHAPRLVLEHQRAHDRLIGPDAVLRQQGEQHLLLPVVVAIGEVLEEVEHVHQHRHRHVGSPFEATGDGLEHVEHGAEAAMLVHQDIEKSHLESLHPRSAESPRACPPPPERDPPPWAAERGAGCGFPAR